MNWVFVDKILVHTLEHDVSLCQVIGYGKWIRNGKMSFKNVKYVDQKLLLSFDGCCDGKKVLGRLQIYHDNGSASPRPKRKSSVRSTKLMFEENDLDDEDDLFGVSRRVHMVDADRDSDDEDEDEEEEHEEDDDDRISFIQMIIVSPIDDS